MAARNRITVDSLVEELDEAKALAMSVEQPSAAISAVMSKAKLVGLLIEKRETGAPGEFGAMSEAQTLELVKAELGEEAAANLAKALAAADNAPQALPDEVDPLPPQEPTNEGSSSLN